MYHLKTYEGLKTEFETPKWVYSSKEDGNDKVKIEFLKTTTDKITSAKKEGNLSKIDTRKKERICCSRQALISTHLFNMTVLSLIWGCGCTQSKQPDPTHTKWINRIHCGLKKSPSNSHRYGFGVGSERIFRVVHATLNTSRQWVREKEPKSRLPEWQSISECASVLLALYDNNQDKDVFLNPEIEDCPLTLEGRMICDICGAPEDFQWHSTVISTLVLGEKTPVANRYGLKRTHFHDGFLVTCSPLWSAATASNSFEGAQDTCRSSCRVKDASEPLLSWHRL